VARQLRLRDIGGIIVVDFIDMVLEANRDLVLRRLVECLARDRTRHQVAEVTSLGLVQMTRKRIGTGLLETFSTPCDCCGGRGVVTTSDPVTVKQGSDDRTASQRRRSSTPKRAASPRKKAAAAPADESASAPQQAPAPVEEPTPAPAEAGGEAASTDAV
jgi:ribonuclease E